MNYRASQAGLASALERKRFHRLKGYCDIFPLSGDWRSKVGCCCCSDAVACVGSAHTWSRAGDGRAGSVPRRAERSRVRHRVRCHRGCDTGRCCCPGAGAPRGRCKDSRCLRWLVLQTLGCVNSSTASVRLLLLLVFGKSSDQATLSVLHAGSLSGLCQSVGPRNSLTVL